MEYSIQELARLAGITTRTLRWYDTINLLKPSRIAESGYRYYGTAEVDRLQDILFYRALGVELAQIKECLDDPSFHRLTALRNHLAVLEARQTKLTLLIQSVQDTIKAEERNEMMADEKKFEALKHGVLEQNEKVYGEEARALYGNEAVEASKASVLKLTAEQYPYMDSIRRIYFMASGTSCRGKAFTKRSGGGRNCENAPPLAYICGGYIRCCNAPRTGEALSCRSAFYGVL